jgi:hypothetical protein
MNDGNETNSSGEPLEGTETEDKSLLNPDATTTDKTDTEGDKSEADDKDKSETDDAPIVLTVEDITFPDGVEVDETLRDEFLAVLNDRDKPVKEQAQALIDLQVKAAQAASEASSKQWGEMQTQWKDEVKADPDIGGEKLQPAIANIGKLIEQYGSTDLVKVLDFTGAGNNVHMIKFLAGMAEKLTEGTPTTGTPTNQQTDAAARMFPSMKGTG